MKKVLAVGGYVIGGLAVLAVVALGIAVALGYASINLTQSGSQLANGRPAACDDQDIQAYNKFVTTFVSTDEARQEKSAGMQALVDQLKAKDGFADDPTCRFIQYSAAVVNEKADDAQAAVERLEQLSQEGVYPNNQLLDLAGIQSMSDRIKVLTDTNTPDADSQGRG